MDVRFFLTAGVGAWVRLLYLRRFARKYLLRRRGMLVLDAGFGGGEYLGWLARRLRKRAWLATLAFVFGIPDDGNVLIVCQK